jgi:hypothetical protein
MIRKAIALVALLTLVACSMPDMSADTECPREGGIGGTGACTIAQ